MYEEEGQYIRYYSFRDIAHSSIKEKSSRISSRSGCPTNTKSSVLVLLQIAKSSHTTVKAQNYLAMHKAESTVGFCAFAEKVMLNVT